MCLPQRKRAFSFAMPCQGWSLHLQKALNASYKMKIKSLPTDYIKLPLLHGLPLLLIELRGVGAPHFNTRDPSSGPSGSSLININHPREGAEGFRDVLTLLWLTRSSLSRSSCPRESLKAPKTCWPQPLLDWDLPQSFCFADWKTLSLCVRNE